MPHQRTVFGSPFSFGVGLQIELRWSGVQVQAACVVKDRRHLVGKFGFSSIVFPLELEFVHVRARSR